MQMYRESRPRRKGRCVKYNKRSSKDYDSSLSGVVCSKSFRKVEGENVDGTLQAILRISRCRRMTFSSYSMRGLSEFRNEDVESHSVRSSCLQIEGCGPATGGGDGRAAARVAPTILSLKICQKLEKGDQETLGTYAIFH